MMASRKPVFRQENHNNNSTDSHQDLAMNSFSAAGISDDASLSKSSIDSLHQVIMKNVPEHLENIDLWNMCSQFARVTSVHGIKSSRSTKFAKCPTKTDAEAVVTGMRNNRYNITVELSHASKNLQSPSNPISNQALGVGDGLLSRNQLSSLVNNNKSHGISPNEYSHESSLSEIAREVIKIISPELKHIRNVVEEIQLMLIDKTRSGTVVSEPLSQNNLIASEQKLQNGSQATVANSSSSNSQNLHQSSVNNSPRKDITTLNESKNLSISMNSSGRSDISNSPKLSLRLKAQRTHALQIPSQPLLQNSIPSTSKSDETHTQQFVEKQEPSSKLVVPKNLEESSQLSEKFSAEKNLREATSIYCVPMPKSGTLVTLTALGQSTDHVYIRSIDTTAEYSKTCSKINQMSQTAKPLKALPERGGVVLSQYGEAFFRANVIKVHSEKEICVAYIDFGNIETKALSDLREAPAKCLAFQRLSIKAKLADVPKFEISASLENFLEQYLENSDEKPLRILYDTTDKVKLISEKENINLNMEISKHKPSPVTVAPVKRSQIRKELIPRGCKEKVIVTDTTFADTGYISAVPVHHMDTINSINRRIKEVALSSCLPHSPTEEEICIAKNPILCEWSRAECIENRHDNTCYVQFIDYGYAATISLKDIRPYPHDLIEPSYTCDCLIMGLPHNNETVTKRIQEMYPRNTKITFDSTEPDYEDESVVVYLENLLSQLEAEGLI